MLLFFCDIKLYNYYIGMVVCYELVGKSESPKSPESPESPKSPESPESPKVWEVSPLTIQPFTTQTLTSP